MCDSNSSNYPTASCQRDGHPAGRTRPHRKNQELLASVVEKTRPNLVVPWYTSPRAESSLQLARRECAGALPRLRRDD